MAPHLQQVINSAFGVSLAARLGRSLPRRLGYALADFAAERVASQRDLDLVQAVRANQWVVRGETLDKAALDEAVRETLRHAARAIFDLYHYVRNPEAARRLIVLDSAVERLARRPEFDSQGLMLVGLHLSSFDLVMQWVCQQGLRPMILTLPDPQGGRRLEYEQRKRIGLNLVPASREALRHGVRHLRQGGLVLTGIDRPIHNPSARPRFFGRPAALPLHHIYLATKARVPVIIMAPQLRADGRYHLLASDPIAMEPHPDRKAALLRNAENVLGLAERFIRVVPQQWSISLPVWPETLALVPG
jgi:KDO2-lipid IV(A) lauroyltransferase